AVAAVRDHGLLAAVELAALLGAEATAALSRPSRILDEIVAQREHRGETLLALERLNAVLGSEHRRGGVEAVASVAAAPAAGHPVVPHEVRLALDSLIP